MSCPSIGPIGPSKLIWLGPNHFGQVQIRLFQNHFGPIEGEGINGQIVSNAKTCQQNNYYSVKLRTDR